MYIYLLSIKLICFNIIFTLILFFAYAYAYLFLAFSSVWTTLINLALPNYYSHIFRCQNQPHFMKHNSHSSWPQHLWLTHKFFEFTVVNWSFGQIFKELELISSLLIFFSISFSDEILEKMKKLTFQYFVRILVGLFC